MYKSKICCKYIFSLSSKYLLVYLLLFEVTCSTLKKKSNSIFCVSFSNQVTSVSSKLQSSKWVVAKFEVTNFEIIFRTYCKKTPFSLSNLSPKNHFGNYLVFQTLSKKRILYFVISNFISKPLFSFSSLITNVLKSFWLLKSILAKRSNRFFKRKICWEYSSQSYQTFFLQKRRIFPFFATKLGRCLIHTFFPFATNSQA